MKKVTYYCDFCKKEKSRNALFNPRVVLLRPGASGPGKRFHDSRSDYNPPAICDSCLKKVADIQVKVVFK